jgi:FtsP/CotA-like multicopper oxidase with cupredoxin domain
MKPMTKKIAYLKTRLLLPVLVAGASLAPAAHAAAPGITTPTATFNLTAADSYLNQPDGSTVYSWGYGCAAGFAPNFVPSVGGVGMPGQNCPTMQIPGPTLVVTEGQKVTINLINALPGSAGNTSILFPGFQVTGSASAMQPATCTATTAAAQAPQGLLTTEAANGCSVSYTFTATSPGTRSYYSGTQGDLQIEMGLYGAIIVLPAHVPAACTTGLPAANVTAEKHWGESDFRLADAAYDNPNTCYDREYLFQFSEMDANIHKQAEAQVLALAGCTAGSQGCSLDVPTEPYHPAYFMINGRSMPDDMDVNYGSEYPHQPYNGNPHLHPGEQVLLRIIGQGRWQHPFHEHANHVRILARDGNLILTPDGNGLAGAPLFTTTTTPGQTMDGIFYFTGRGLNWDMYGHLLKSATGDPLAALTCTPDANGYNTGDPTAVNFWEWCQDHNKPLEVAPFGDVASGGPATLPNPLIFTNGNWYGGSPYLGPDATLRATTTLRDVGVNGSNGCVTGKAGSANDPNCSNLLPSNTQGNPANERGWAFMWHSHNEREITTNNVFPGGMMMMMLVDSREFVIDESN